MNLPLYKTHAYIYILQHIVVIVESRIPLDTVTKIYSGQTLTKEMVLTIVEELEDWEQLEADLNEIGYPYDFN